MIRIATPAWLNDAACNTTDPELFFPNYTTDRHARAVCARCPVATPCLTAALQAEGDTPTDHRFGIFGGLDPGERKQLANRARTKRSA